MTQKFVTLPREVVKLALESMDESYADTRQGRALADALRAALEQPQIQSGGIPPGWRLVPVEPTQAQLNAWQSHFGLIEGAYVAMLNAAPQPPTTEQSPAVNQPQDEQEPVGTVSIEVTGSTTKVDIEWGDLPPQLQAGSYDLYTRPQPQQEPLSTARIDELIEEGIFGGNPYELVRRLEEERGVFMTRPLTVEQIDGIINVLDPIFLDTPTGFEEDFCRAIKAAHDIK